MTSITVKITSTADKKDVQKLQRAIIDGLEDVKGQDIQVFDTEHITSLFERVIIASGTSNRQTKALAASVRDAVRDAGFSKPRIEGEENGEWIIVDCGAAVAHIMQPTIRQYYHLEELWGEKPVKLKLGAPAPLVKAAKPESKVEATPRAKPGSGVKTAFKTRSRTSVKTAIPMPVMQSDPNYVGKVGKTNDWTAKRNATVPAEEPLAKPVRVATNTTATKKSSAKPVVKTAAKPAVKSVAVKPVVKTPIVKIVAARKAPARKVAVKTTVKKPAAKKTAIRSA